MALIDLPSPMAGTVLELLVVPGDRVSAGQELLILESMKMEIPVESSDSGAVAEVCVAPPEVVEEGQVLLRLEV